MSKLMKMLVYNQKSDTASGSLGGMVRASDCRANGVQVLVAVEVAEFWGK